MKKSRGDRIQFALFGAQDWFCIAQGGMPL
jgi:hypothetical protein